MKCVLSREILLNEEKEKERERQRHSMAHITLKCDRCGKKTDRRDGYMDRAMRQIFCTKECYRQIGESTACVMRFNLDAKAREDKPHNVFYNCGGVQLHIETVKVGEKMVDYRDPEKTEMKSAQTKVLIVIGGRARINIMKEDQSFPLELDETPLEENDEKNLIVIPAGVTHSIENIGTKPLKFFTIYHSSMCDNKY